MQYETAKLMNWQLSKALDLDPSQSHVIREEMECGCYSEVTREDYSEIYVDGRRVNDSKGVWFYSLSGFIDLLTKQGKPDSLEGVAPVTIVEDHEFECYYDSDDYKW